MNAAGWPGQPGKNAGDEDGLIRSSVAATSPASPPTSAATVVYSTSTPTVCGIDGCQCCPPGATFCECHDCYECGEIDCDCT